MGGCREAGAHVDPSIEGCVRRADDRPVPVRQQLIVVPLQPCVQQPPSASVQCGAIGRGQDLGVVPIETVPSPTPLIAFSYSSSSRKFLGTITCAIPPSTPSTLPHHTRHDRPLVHLTPPHAPRPATCPEPTTRATPARLSSSPAPPLPALFASASSPRTGGPGRYYETSPFAVLIHAKSSAGYFDFNILRGLYWKIVPFLHR